MKKDANKFAKLCREIIEHLNHCEVFEKEEEQMMKLAKELLLEVARPMD